MQFIKVRFKNILSFGNDWNEFELDNNQLNLITGPNGAGKSALLEVIYFGFTGKPYRKIRKIELVNNVNKKNLVVEFDIIHNNSNFKIIRGLKPSIFEIYKDGELVNEDSHIKDYQLQLESMFGIDSKSFKQTIMMSSRYYEPFLDLNPRQKREFIENIFSIKIFSDMTIFLKRKIHSTKLLLRDAVSDVQNFSHNVELMKSFNDKQKQQILESKTQIQEEIKDLENKIELAVKQIDIIQEEIEGKENEINELEKETIDKDSVTENLNNNTFNLNSKHEKIKFLNDNNACDKCGQDINKDFRDEQIDKYNTQTIEIKKEIEKFNLYLAEISKIQEKITLILENIQAKHKKIISNNSSVKIFNLNIQDKKKEINNLSKKDIDVSDLENSIKILEKYKKQKIKLEMFMKYVGITLELLSEKGIRKFIIDKYIPIFNTLLNQNLKKFEAHYSVLFNNEFEETIIARGYEDLSYFSLSSGEKQRLDTALVFSFLDLCRLKNSIDTNVIFFDEVLDQSFDQTGIEGILKIFRELKSKGYTIFVVSHRETIIESFEKIYSIKKKHFSEIEILG